MGILGTRAPLIYDLNLILQIVVIAILLAGAYYAKRKRNFNIHGKAMSVALVLNIVGMLFVMAPRLISSLSYLVSTVNQLPSMLTIIHPIFGGLAEILGLFAVATLRPCGSKMGKNVRNLMIVTFALWVVAFLFGVSVYIAFYVM